MAQLLQANLPLSLAVELQTCGPCLDFARWSMRYTNGGFSVAFFWPTNKNYQGYAAQPHRYRRRRKPKSRLETKGPDAICRESEQSNKCASKPQPVNREPSPIDEHQ